MDLHNVYVNQESIDNVMLVLRSTQLNEGRYVEEFEQGLRKTFGIQNPVTVNSCTSALHLSLVCAGIGAGDEVILPAQTFLATGTAILMAGAIPVFADINPMTGNLDPQSFKDKITSNTRAVIPVHWGGLPCNMKEIHAIASENGIEVIEDAAHALGAGIFMPDQTYKPIGAISKYTCFSFQTIKFLTTGDGGAIGTTDPEIAARLRRLRWFGFDRKTMKKHYEGDRDCSLTELGYKYHMNNINAAIGLGALKDARKRLARRREIAGAFRCMLNNVPGLTLLEKGWEYDHSYWVFTILVENRLRFIQLMRDVGDIPVSVMDRRIDVHPIFGGKTKNLVGQEEFDKKQISIPVHDELKDEEIDKIIKTIWRGW
jgi:perosamine synthetase